MKHLVRILVLALLASTLLACQAPPSPAYTLYRDATAKLAAKDGYTAEVNLTVSGGETADTPLLILFSTVTKHTDAYRLSATARMGEETLTTDLTYVNETLYTCANERKFRTPCPRDAFLTAVQKTAETHGPVDLTPPPLGEDVLQSPFLQQEKDGSVTLTIRPSAASVAPLLAACALGNPLCLGTPLLTISFDSEERLHKLLLRADLLDEDRHTRLGAFVLSVTYLQTEPDAVTAPSDAERYELLSLSIR